MSSNVINNLLIYPGFAANYNIYSEYVCEYMSLSIDPISLILHLTDIEPVNQIPKDSNMRKQYIM